jgi:hypothetical protein
MSTITVATPDQKPDQKPDSLTRTRQPSLGTPPSEPDSLWLEVSARQFHRRERRIWEASGLSAGKKWRRVAGERAGEE